MFLPTMNKKKEVKTCHG